jgi:F0F1-type ATP synthase alpha subunit
MKQLKDLLDRGARLTEILKQSNFQPLDITSQIITIASGVSGLLDKVELENLEKYQLDLYNIFYSNNIYKPFKNFIKTSDPRNVIGFLNFQKNLTASK